VWQGYDCGRRLCRTAGEKFFGWLRRQAKRKFYIGLLYHLKPDAMKNSILPSVTIFFCFIAFVFLMSYTRPNAEEPKQYIIVTGEYNYTKAKVLMEKFAQDVNQKLAEGWHLQGGTFMSGTFVGQAMVK